MTMTADQLHEIILANDNVLITGDAGTPLYELVHQACAKLDAVTKNYVSSNLLSADMIGIPLPGGNRTRPSGFMNAEVMIFNDFGRVHPTTAPLVFQLVESGRIGDINFPNLRRVVAVMRNEVACEEARERFETVIDISAR